MQAIQLSAHFMELHLTTSAGTYVKEFVHGDLGRTVPSIGSLLHCTADILQLDVMGVEDQWSKETTATSSTTTTAAAAGTNTNGTAYVGTTTAAAASAAADTLAAADSSTTIDGATASTAEVEPTTADTDAQTSCLVTNSEHAGDADGCCKAVSNGSSAAASIDTAAVCDMMVPMYCTSTDHMLLQCEDTLSTNSSLTQ
jgi:hypothetical protein